MALWVNVHGGVLAGVGLVAVALGATRRRAPRGTISAATRRSPPSASSSRLATALLVNPYGFRLLRFLVLDVMRKFPSRNGPPVRMFDTSFPIVQASAGRDMFGVAVLRPRLVEVAVVLVTATVALRHQRHIPLFAIAATPLVAASLAHLAATLAGKPHLPLDRRFRARRRDRGRRPAARRRRAPPSARIAGTIAVSPALLPRAGRSAFLAQNDIVGNVALPFRWGEYALWALPAGTRVAVDDASPPRIPESLLADAWSFMSGGQGWDALLERYPTDIVVADRAQAAGAAAPRRTGVAIRLFRPGEHRVRAQDRAPCRRARALQGRPARVRPKPGLDRPSPRAAHGAPRPPRGSGLPERAVPAFPGEAAAPASAKVLAAWRP
jgi:hypothetical protein